jgi:citrate lyase subunit beta/citryl-CoA lyase
MLEAMRSKLFVPGSRPELFAKALVSGADALSFDLEDSVAEDRKAAARAQLRDFLRSGALAGSTQSIIVRVNPLDSAHFAGDVQAVVQPGVQLINLPKPRDTEDVIVAARAIAAAQLANGVPGTVGLLVNIETPGALRHAADLAGADPRVAGLQLGLGDLFEPLGIARRDPSAVRQAMFAVRMAAGEAGVFAYDAAFAHITDEDGYVAEARQARDLGFVGKSCIHPRQIALANAVFQPTPDEIAHAQRVVQTARDAQARSVGAWVVDGMMIDAPFVQRAQSVVALATRLGLLSPDRP